MSHGVLWMEWDSACDCVAADLQEEQTCSDPKGGLANLCNPTSSREVHEDVLIRSDLPSMCRGLFPAQPGENKTVRYMGPKTDNIYTVGVGPLQDSFAWNFSSFPKPLTQNFSSFSRLTYLQLKTLLSTDFVFGVLIHRLCVFFFTSLLS